MKNAPLQQQISELEDSIRRTEMALQEKRIRLAKIRVLTPITNKDLYARMGDILVINVGKGKYEHILGGDGRSSPWSENREGLVAKVQIKDPSIYLSEDQVSIIRKYVMDVYGPDYIEFVTKG